MADHRSDSPETLERLAGLELRMQALEKARGPSGWLDRTVKYLPLLVLGNLLVAAPAMIVSAAIAYFAFEQADATKKMQVTAVWPRVTYASSNMDEEGEADITLTLLNKGVGPAIIRGMRVQYRGTSHLDFRSLLEACCTEDSTKLSVGIGTINGEVIRPGESMLFAVLPKVDKNADAWERFNAERFQLKIATCYCSVFDDCWVDDGGDEEPQPVAQCPTDWVQYTGFPQNGGL